MEADFQREYGMDLSQELMRGMSWRRFLVLLGGFGPNSAYVSVTASQGDKITNQKAGERAVEKMLG